MKVALAPIVTDLPIIILTVFILGELSGFQGILGVISLAGGVLILYMGYCMRFLGIVLCAFAVVLFRDGLKLLGMI